MVMITGPGDEISAGDEVKSSRSCSSALVAAVLDERQPAGFQGIENVPIDVVDIDAEAGLGKCKHQRDADVAPAPDDGQICRPEGRSGRSTRLRSGKIQLTAPVVVRRGG